MPISEGAHLLDWDANDNLLYEGWAIRKGANTASAVWKIKKYFWSQSGGGSKYVLDEETFADGNELYDNIWDNRAALTYLQAV